MGSYRYPPFTGGPAEQWSDQLRERLFEQRTIVVTERLDDAVAGDLMARLMALDALGDDAITLALSCPGGSLDAALAVIDVIDVLGVPVHATVAGRLEGPPVGVLCAATRRSAGPRSSLRLCEEDISFEGPARVVQSFIDDHNARLAALVETIARRSPHSSQEIARDLAAGRYLDATAALAYGLIDEIAQPDAAILRLRPPAPEPGFGFRPTPM